MTPLEIRALETIEEMRALGAVFEVEPGANGQPTFVWRARPAGLRDAVLTYWQSVPKPSGLKAAMARVITHQRAGEVL